MFATNLSVMTPPSPPSGVVFWEVTIGCPWRIHDAKCWPAFLGLLRGAHNDQLPETAFFHTGPSISECARLDQSTLCHCWKLLFCSAHKDVCKGTVKTKRKLGSFERLPCRNVGVDVRPCHTFESGNVLKIY